jgi:transcriptional regulator with XRE-family HTH domain
MPENTIHNRSPFLDSGDSGPNACASAADRLFLEAEKADKLRSVRSMAQIIAENLRRRRIATGMSQFELASKANISQKYLSKLESSRTNGNVCPSVTVFFRLCDALDVSPDEMRQPAAASAKEAGRRMRRNSVRRELSRLALELPKQQAAAVKQIVELLLDADAAKKKGRVRSGKLL